MRIDAIHNRMDVIMDKLQSGYFSPEEKDEALDFASMAKFNVYLPIYGKDMDSREALKPFKVVKQFETNSEGVFTLTDCSRLLSGNLMVLKDGKALKRGFVIPNEDEIDGKRNSQLKPITLMYPIVEVLNETEYRVEPVMETGGEVTYLKRPNKPKFAYSSISDDVPVYDDAQSVQLNWNDKYVDDIIFSAIGFLGIPLSSEWLVQNGFSVKSNQK